MSTKVDLGTFMNCNESMTFHYMETYYLVILPYRVLKFFISFFIINTKKRTSLDIIFFTNPYLFLRSKFLKAKLGLWKSRYFSLKQLYKFILSRAVPHRCVTFLSYLSAFSRLLIFYYI